MYVGTHTHIGNFNYIIYENLNKPKRSHIHTNECGNQLATTTVVELNGKTEGTPGYRYTHNSHSPRNEAEQKKNEREKRIVQAANIVQILV